jgi:predicted DNA-binding transcriptional regulator YafY
VGLSLRSFAGSSSDTSAARAHDAPTEHVARIAWMLVTLLTSETLEYATYCDRFGRSLRQFQRDVYQLREIGRDVGFHVSPRTGGRVLLDTKNTALVKVGAQTRDATATLRRIAAALGGPVELEMRHGIGDGSVDRQHGFLHVRAPVPIDGAKIADVFSFLKDAAAASARVEFPYTTARAQRSVRTVEPYHVIGRNGRYYLVGYDLVRRDWRHFALDAIGGPFRRAGTFTARAVPGRFLEERAVGWIQGAGAIDVTIRVSPVIAATVTARQWQRTQRVVPRPDGSADVTISVEDIGEAVRWALSFGSEAVVVAPPEAVVAAHETATCIASAHAASNALYADQSTVESYKSKNISIVRPA